uniref:Uncharacterized protein n=1 Tax=Avena sativa TaxID=4498 RepID=A0ACD5U9N1_AVESA
MDLASLTLVLRAALSHNPEERKAAEASLDQIQYAQQHLVRLLQIIVDGNCDIAVRQVASIHFKNFVSKAWSPIDPEETQTIPEADKSMVRENILGFVTQLPPLLRAQLGESIKTLILADYPEQWPSLLHWVTRNLESQDQIFGALYVLRILSRKYEVAYFCCFCCDFFTHTLQLSFTLPPLYLLGKKNSDNYPIFEGDKFLDVYEEVLEIVSYMTFYAPTISLEMWSLWPLMMEALNDWAIDFFENILVPLDNYISRGTEHFVSCKEPDYQQSLWKALSTVMTDQNMEDSDILPAPKLIEVFFQNCKGQVDHWVEPYLRLTIDRLRRAEKPYLKCLLVQVVRNLHLALLYLV